ncbi:MAG: integrating conjugative element protein [Proteobacteria bacterium]|nr:integrating conjugative element protein [Pseudomonadota bacterium]
MTILLLWVRILAFVLLVLGFGPARSQLEVIYDNGRTRPLAPYLEVLEPGPEKPLPAPRAAPSWGAADRATLLPIRSPGLSPGPVRARAHARPQLLPFFMIGADARSRKWLVRHRAHLVSIGAVGLLVAADSEQDLRQIAHLARGLAITPASGSDLARVLGLEHYPVLITASGISQ